MNHVPARGPIVGALAFFGVLVATTPAHAQEKWTADLMICGRDNANPSAWIWQRPGDPCDASIPTFVPDTGNGVLLPNRDALYLNQPGDFAEVIKPASGNVGAIHHLLIADSLNGRVLRFLDTGSAVAYVGELAAGSFVVPIGVAGDADGNILVADFALNTVQRFSWNGDSIGQPLTRCTTDPDPLLQPYRLTVAPGTRITPGSEQGTVLIVDGGDNRVIVCDATMNWVSSFGGPLDISGGDPGLFSTPTGIAVDQIGHIYVADPNNGRVQVFDGMTSLQLGSAPVWIISNSPGAGTTVPGMNYPFGLAVDANGRLLIADNGANAVWVLDTFANQLKQLNVRIGTASAGSFDLLPLPPGPPGELQVPTNISLDSTGRLLIADSNNMRVQRFSHPLMTVTVTPPTEPVFVGADLVLTVAVQAASGQFTSVIPIVSVLGSGASTILSGAPVISPDANDPLVPPAATTVTAGLGATIFTITYHTTGGGPLAFSVYASGIPQIPPGQTGRVLSPDGAGITAQIAIGVAAGTVAPRTTPTVSGTAVSVGFVPNQVTWYTTRPVVHLAATGTPTPEEIHHKLASNDLFPPEPNTTDFTSCSGASCDLLAIATDGLTVVWYRAKSTTPQGPLVEPWKSLRVYYDAVMPGVGDYTSSPPANAAGWNNSAFVISYSLFTGLVGLPKDARGKPLVASPGTIAIATNPQHSTDSASFSPMVTVTDAAGRSSGAVPVGMFKLDTVAPTLSNLAVVAPVPLNSFLFYDLTGQPNVGVAVNATAGDALSGIQNVCYDLTGGTICRRATDVGAGAFTMTVMGSVTNATIWALDAAGNASVAQTFSVKITRTTPVANVASVSTLEDQAVSDVLTTTGAAPGATLTYAISTQPAHGNVVPLNAAPGAFTYTPTSNYSGADSFTFTVSDGSGVSQPAPIHITINPVNDAPVASNLAINVTQGQSVSGQVIAADVDNATLTYTVSVPQVFGTLTAFNTTTGAFTYAASPTGLNADSFQVTVSDGWLSSTATVSITVRNANLPPVALNDAYATPWNTVLTVPAMGVLLNDTDPNNDPLTAIKVTNTAHGTVTLNGNGSLTYKPTANYSGLDSFTYTARDGALDSNVATVKITITSPCRGDDDDRGGRTHRHRDGDGDDHDRGRNGHHDGDGCEHDREAHDRDHDDRDKMDWDECRPGTPASHSDTYQTSKNKALTVAPNGVLKNDGRYAATAAVYTAPLHGTVTLAPNGGLVYTPVQNFVGTDVFSYVPRSATGMAGAVTSVTIKVSAHFDGDNCDHDRHRNGHHGNDDCDHDRDTRRGRDGDRDE